MNKLTLIGYLSDKHCYLNLPEEECIKRYCDYKQISLEEFEIERKDLSITTFEFKDEFYAYDAYGNG